MLDTCNTLFALEDIYGLHVGEIDGELCLRLDKSKGTTYLSMFDMLLSWQKQSALLESGEITKEEYDQWRYTYPQKEIEHTTADLSAQRSKCEAEETDSE